MAQGITERVSKRCYCPAAVSSFFEIHDTNPDGSRINDPLRIGARGGGFTIGRGTVTTASEIRKIRTDTVVINNRRAPNARTTLSVIRQMRRILNFGPVLITHEIDPPIGSGFGTSGSGALGAAIALSDLYSTRFTVAQVSSFAHIAEIESLTGLGTVASISSGIAGIGIVTEPGSIQFGRVDRLLCDERDYVLVCACFGPISKPKILTDPRAKNLVNEFGGLALKAVLGDPTPATLLTESRVFAERSGLSNDRLLRLADKAREFGAVGASQNMIGNAVHFLVQRTKYRNFMKSFSKYVPPRNTFESQLLGSTPKLF